MKITEITEDMLPVFLIEVRSEDGTWNQWVHEPLLTQKLADDHRALIIQEYKFPEGIIRVGAYTKDHWRLDLINEVMKDQDAMQRALSILRNGTLLDLLK